MIIPTNSDWIYKIYAFYQHKKISNKFKRMLDPLILGSELFYETK